MIWIDEKFFFENPSRQIYTYLSGNLHDHFALTENYNSFLFNLCTTKSAKLDDDAVWLKMPKIPKIHTDVIWRKILRTLISLEHYYFWYAVFKTLFTYDWTEIFHVT